MNTLTTFLEKGEGEEKKGAFVEIWTVSYFLPLIVWISGQEYEHVQSPQS